MENPFFSTQNEKIKSTSKILYIIGSNEDINILDYEKITSKELVDFCDKLYIIPSNMQLLNISHHTYNSKLIKGKYLSLIDNKNYNEEEAIVCIWGINKNYIESYIRQYTIHKNLQDYFKIVKLNHYLKVENYYADINRLNLLIDAPECKYWTIKKNCSRNISQIFIKRTFEEEKKKITNLKVLEEINKAENTEHDYLLFMHKETIYTNIANSLSNYDYYNYIIDEKKYDITYENIYNIITNCNSLKEFYFFVSKLTLTKEYCHLILNNKKVLTLLNDNNYLKFRFNQTYNISFIDKYILLFKYIIGYAWIIFYTEESIKKSHIVETDRFVFDIETANLLPSFPFLNNNPKSNPYFTLLINTELLDYANNINSFGSFKIIGSNIDIYGISTLAGFKEKLNIFCTYKYNNELFNNIDWSNIAICGSVMAACLTNYNPLQYYFNSNNYKKNFEDYIEHFYKDSDLDIMCNCNNILDYIKTFFRFFNQLSNNIKAIDPTEIIEYNIKKTTYFYISSDIIYKLKIKLNITTDKINFSNEKVIDEIYKYYLKEHVKYINQYIILDIFTNHNYNFLFEPSSKDNLIILVNNMADNIHLFNNIKFEIYAKEPRKVLRKKIEFFKIKYNNFFSSVSKFHLNVVRSYFDGENVYLLPSCITALKTFINIDLKYFAGNTSPYNIIKKYRYRGFGTILNNSEKIAFVESIINKETRPNYNISKIMHKILGTMYINKYKYYNFATNKYNIIITNSYTNLCKIYCETLGDTNKDLINFILENTYTINHQGSINYYKDYIIHLIYDKF
tara:strand:- start:2591 stop:4972 length:2382 start_codon:yes stop_codon:yes gene_type:complete